MTAELLDKWTLANSDDDSSVSDRCSLCVDCWWVAAFCAQKLQMIFINRATAISWELTDDDADEDQTDNIDLNHRLAFRESLTHFAGGVGGSGRGDSVVVTSTWPATGQWRRWSQRHLVTATTRPHTRVRVRVVCRSGSAYVAARCWLRSAAYKLRCLV